MGDRTRARCVVCDRHRREVGEISWTGKCRDCGVSELTSNVVQMVDRRGPNFDRWRRAMAACVGGVLTDDLLDETRQRA